MTIRFPGSVGNYCGGLNSGPTIYVERNVGWAAGEAMAKGKVVVEGNANMATGASMRGGTIHIKGSAAARCGVSLKGGTLIVEGDVGYLSAFMTHAGDLIVCGSTGAAFADSLWQGNVWVAGEIRSLGTDATIVEAPLTTSSRACTACCARTASGASTIVASVPSERISPATQTLPLPERVGEGRAGRAAHDQVARTCVMNAER